MSIRDSILANAKSNDRKPIQAFGITLYAPKLGLRQAAEMREIAKGSDELSQPEQINRIASIVASFTVDEQGNKVFNAEDVEVLANHQDSDSLIRVFEAIVAANTITESQVETSKN
jgi:hypothetical protein